MIKIAVTGGIACGKSTVGTYLRELGVSVCDADELAHAAMVPGSQVCRDIEAAFGAAALSETGGVDRVKLGDLVFSDERDRELLNAIVHPVVRDEWTAWLDRQPLEVAAAAVLIPLLYEGGFQRGWDATVCVWAPIESQIIRLLDRNLTREQALARIRVQMPLLEKVKMSDYVLINSGSRAVLKSQVAELMQRLMAR